MFTRVVVWLLVACFPGLLMLAALGLGQLEYLLSGGSPTTTSAAGRSERADGAGVRTLDRARIPKALEYPRRQQERVFGLTVAPSAEDPVGRHRAETFFAADAVGRVETGLPTRIHGHYRTNRQFPVTRHIDRV
ncbi:hypothetical protein [Mycobacterium sp.]|uniref:hypothetical protein n=1 Tax=Mycobacterium sp. TaxID=1785 RepID=UPI003A850AE5